MQDGFWLNAKSTREVYEECATEHKLPVLIDDSGRMEGRYG